MAIENLDRALQQLLAYPEGFRQGAAEGLAAGAPIVAFVEKLRAKPRRIASLYVGRREGDWLLYAGKVRSGYTEAVARDLRERLDPFIRQHSPLSEPVKKPKATWVEPVIEAEVAYSTLTENGLLREAVFKRLRQDREMAAARKAGGRVPDALP